MDDSTIDELVYETKAAILHVLKKSRIEDMRGSITSPNPPSYVKHNIASPAPRIITESADNKSKRLLVCYRLAFAALK